MSGGQGGQLDEGIVAQRCHSFQGHVAGALHGLRQYQEPVQRRMGSLSVHARAARYRRGARARRRAVRARRAPSRPAAGRRLARQRHGRADCRRVRGVEALPETAVSLSRPETDPPHFSTHGQNPGLFALSYLSRTLCYLGLLDQARATIGRCLTIAARRAGDPGHLYGHVNALVHAARVYNHCGDLAGEKRFAEEARDIARRNHFAYYEAVSRCHLGWVAGCQGSLAEGIDTMLAGLAALEKTGTSLALSQFFLMLAQLYIVAGRWREAAAALDRAPQGNPRWDADVERVRGEFLSLHPEADPAAAERAYRASLDVARRQRAGLLILKSSLGLSEFLRRSERRQEARDVLAAGLAALPEGRDTAASATRAAASGEASVVQVAAAGNHRRNKMSGLVAGNVAKGAIRHCLDQFSKAAGRVRGSAGSATRWRRGPPPSTS